MNIEDLRAFCLSFPATEERLPFNPDYLVFFVYDKMFCLIDITDRTTSTSNVLPNVP